MNHIESALVNAISKHPKLPLVIAYSGGVDSQVLLHAFASLKKKKLLSNQVTVCHVNHGLSENAAVWQLFAKQQCQQFNLPLKVCLVNVQAQAQQSLEALARDARYRALQSIYNESSLIITGHHRDDQAETFLLALKRGSGLKGLSAMATQTKQGKDILVRPMLTISRSEIIDYAKSCDLTWVEDESNNDNRFDRNFIRNDIMPLLINRWPSMIKTINRSSEHCREGQLLLSELATEDLRSCQHAANSLHIEPLSQLSQGRFNNLIRHFLAQNHCLMPSTEQLAQLSQQLTADDDKNPAVKLGDHYLRRYRNVLHLTIDYEDVSHWQADVTLDNKQSVIELPNYLGELNFIKTGYMEAKEGSQQVLLPNEDEKIIIRFHHNNPLCLPDYRNRSRSLKKVLQELNIPPWQRKRIPFLYYGDKFVAALSFFVCQEFVPPISEPSLQINWTQ